ncbi:hypothetical protein OA264_02220 [Alphaproteobacteria bacterium]|nr:hypothetical protein [Alphaproteobacteria bacterium]
MYLNIVNNLSFANKKNRNSISIKKDESKEEKNAISDNFFEEKDTFYNSIFYGQLTENWLKITN